MQDAERQWAGGTAGIPNFAWVDGGPVARGMQPSMTVEAFTALREAGISTVLSLRAAHEYPDDERRRYDVADERAVCAAADLRFHHVACGDYQVPRPRDVVRALAILHDEVQRGGTVYVHCFAGVGRTGVVCGGWRMLYGASGTDVARDYAFFAEESWGRRVALRRPEQTIEQYLNTIGAHHQVWVLLRMARALGRPVDLPADFSVPPQRPKQAGTWQRRFQEQVYRHLSHAYPLIPSAAAGVRTGAAAD